MSEQYHSDSGGLRALNTALGLGAALGALIYARTLPRRRRAVLVYTCWTCAYIMIALIAWVETVPVAVVLGVVSGTLTGSGLALRDTLLMTVVDGDKLARVFSLN